MSGGWMAFAQVMDSLIKAPRVNQSGAAANGGVASGMGLSNAENDVIFSGNSGFDLTRPLHLAVAGVALWGAWLIYKKHRG